MNNTNNITHFERYIYPYLVIAMIFWGISWPSSKILTFYTDPFTLMFLKFFISAIALIPIFLLLNDKRFFSAQVIKPLVVATFFIILYNLFFFYGLKYGLAGLGGIVVTGSNPIFTFLIVAIIDKIDIPKRKKVALIIGLIGTAITLHIENLNLKELVDGGNLFFLLASLSWSLVTIYSTNAKQHLNSLLFSIYLYAGSSVITYILFIDNNSLIEIFTFEFLFWVNLFFVTIITTAISTTIYFKASNILGASNASSFIFLVPIVAVLSSAILLNEVPNITSLIGGTLLIFSVWLINKK
ncbi:MAG: DMT family transporter [Arcobacteraceae bacterium]